MQDFLDMTVTFNQISEQVVLSASMFSGNKFLSFYFLLVRLWEKYNKEKDFWWEQCDIIKGLRWMWLYIILDQLPYQSSYYKW